MTHRPKETKAAILIKQGCPLIVDTIELPSGLNVGQVLVKLHVSGICGSQLGEIDGVKGPDRFLPHLMGHEGFGTVIETGQGVKSVQEGDSVVLHWRPGSGIQSDPPKYLWKGEPLNAGWVTTFNQHAVISENRCTKVPHSTDPDAAALFGCAVTTGFGVVENDAKLRMGESIVVFGAGGIGLNIIQAASLMSASKIIAIDLHDNRLELARHMGATVTINSRREETEAAIAKALGDQHLDVFVDNTGIPEIIEQGYQLTSSKGRVVLVGVPRQGKTVSLNTLPLHFGKILVGSHGGSSNPAEDIPRYLRLLQQGRLEHTRLVTDRYPLDQINSAIEAMRGGGTAGRVMIDL